MHSHMRAHPYALNEIILADTTEAVSSGLQFPVLKNMTADQDKKHSEEKARFKRSDVPRA